MTTAQDRPVGAVPACATPARRALSGRAARRGTLLLGLGIALLAVAGVLAWRHFQRPAYVQGYRVVKEWPHDPESYCQGLVFDGGIFHESAGQYGYSNVRNVELETGKVLKRTDLPPMLFGEGLALVGERLIQLTWQEHVARIYDRTSLKPLDQFEYDGEGWGLAYDGTHLVMSDGSDQLVFRDPATFKEVRRVAVRDRGAPVRNLNELEMVEGEVWANVWKKDYIVRIDPRDGNVVGVVDLTGIFDRSTIPNSDAVLNGIAYDPRTKRLWVTGKLWPKLFEIEVVPRAGK